MTQVRTVRKKLVMSLLALLGVVGVANAGALLRETQALPDIAAPPGGRAYWIARSMRLNGVPMTLKSFATAANAAEVLNHYERMLRTSSDQKTRRGQEGPWQVLGVMASDYFITIRARSTARGTEGTIAVSPPLAHAVASKRTTFPHPDAARVVNLQQYDDEGIEAEHISLVSQRSVAIEAREFSGLLAQHGWQLLRNEHSADRHGGHVIEAQKAAQLAVINLRRRQRGDDTSIMIVWRKA